LDEGADIGCVLWVVAVRIDRPDDGDESDARRAADEAESCGPREPAAPAPPDRADPGDPTAPGGDARPADPADPAGSPLREQRALGYRANADAIYDAHAATRRPAGHDRPGAIDAGCARVEQIERETVTPAMRRIEAEDPDRHLAGLDHRLKGKDRLAEKVENWMAAQPGLMPDEAFRLAKDAIRYSFVYEEAKYTAGVHADCDRIRSAGFQPADRQNSWAEDQYKGINGRWREPGSGQLFDVQFHTQDSYNAKQATHAAYERIRDPSTPPGEVRQLRAYQREVCATIPIPPGATEIPDYNHL